MHVCTVSSTQEEVYSTVGSRIHSALFAALPYMSEVEVNECLNKNKHYDVHKH
jgi:hypothetical protein